MKAKITSYKFPATVMANTVAEYCILGHIEEPDYPLIGFTYVDGPADYVIVDTYWHSEIPKEWNAVFIFPQFPACTTMDMCYPNFALIFPVAGKYTFGVFAGFADPWTGNIIVEDGPYPVNVNASPFIPAKTSLTNVNVPTQAGANIPTNFVITGHVVETGGNPCVGLMYVDGPTPEVNIGGNNIEKGKAFLYGTAKPANACTNLELRNQIIFPQIGTYSLAAIAGYMDLVNQRANYTERQDITVNVTEAPPTPPLQTATITGTVTEALLWGLIKRKSTGAMVSLNQIKTAKTQNGSYTLTDIPLGSYIIKAEKPLFKTQQKSITLTEPKTYTQDFELQPSTILNASITALPILAITLIGYVASRHLRQF